MRMDAERPQIDQLDPDHVDKRQSGMTDEHGALTRSALFAIGHFDESQEF